MTKASSASAEFKGFTLIEVVIVIVIIGILAAIALPNYNKYIMKSRRSAAASFILSAANLENQVLLDLRRYVAVADNAAFANAPTDASPGLKTAVPDKVLDFYNLSIALATAPAVGFTITAVPKGAQASDTGCGSLGYDHTGAKTITGTASVAACW